MTSYVCTVCHEEVVDEPGRETQSSSTHSCGRTSGVRSDASAAVPSDAERPKPSERGRWPKDRLWRKGHSSRPRPGGRIPRSVLVLALLGLLTVSVTYGLRAADGDGDRVTHCPANVFRHDVC